MIQANLMHTGFAAIPDGRYTYVSTPPTASAGSGLGQIQFDNLTHSITWSLGVESVFTGHTTLSGDELLFFQGLYISDLPVTDWFGAGPKNTEGYAGDVSGHLLMDFTGGKLSRLRLDSATTNIVAMVTRDITAPTLEISGKTRGQPKLLQSRITLDGSTNGLYLTMQGDVILNHLTIGHNEEGVGLKSDKVGGDTFIVDTVTVDGRVEWHSHGGVILPLAGRPGVLQTNGHDITVTGNFIGRVGKDLTFSTGEGAGGNITIGATLATDVKYTKGAPEIGTTPATMTLSLGGTLMAGLGNVVIGTNPEGGIAFDMVGNIQGRNVTIRPTDHGAVAPLLRSIGDITAEGNIDIELAGINEGGEVAAAIGTLTSASGNICLRTGPIRGTVGNIFAPNGSVCIHTESAASVGAVTGRTVEKHIGISVNGGLISAEPLTDPVLVNGSTVSLCAYRIHQCPCFRLRDIAFVLSGTEKQFEVRWFEDAHITLNGGIPYEAIGGELTGSAEQGKQASPSAWTAVFGGRSIPLSAYCIDGEHFFNLSDLAKAADFHVRTDGMIQINTAKSYMD